MPKREYVVLEEWSAYIEVVVEAANKSEALAMAKDVIAGETDEGMTRPEIGEPTGRYEVRRAANSDSRSEP